MNKNTPTFRQSTNEKRFNERTVGEKKAQNRPHFERDSRENKPFRDKNKGGARPFKGQERFTEVPQIRETVMDNARGTGNVKVMVKSSQQTVAPKKTGPLSPRAPEKIKKNRAEEMKLCGENACLALFQQRPESIVRVWTTVEIAHRVGDLFSYLAANKKAYHVVDQAELALVSGTEHHGGICMLVKKRRPFTLEGYLDIPRKQDTLVLLDRVKNAHNVGGIIRTCAFYGVRGVIIDDAELLASASAARVAEGGMEYIHPLQTDNIDKALEKLRQAGYQIVHLSDNRQAKPLNKLQFADKTVLVLSETNSAHAQDEAVNLSYANPLKSGLNVAVAAGILLAKRCQ
ncbi:TrmH family RNA methyltransferase [Caviibacterium pharyngocola]|uniref:rRNA methyltransferase n=1 Tax=Caviibacterium pharyngocola TaxID=28159 RepID=A0A2M8RSU7_9PAST|nr:TrmH family RNA methyltransferase [Caviibacterium pharyngocola]PJG81956.1 rRNA methyltransferase [Caviibacterium pharyngocola]